MSSILIVDDEPDNFDVIEILLFKEGYNLTYISSGAEALGRLADIQPDVILLDVMMPELDGVEVCRRIKSDPEWQHVPVIIVTALSSKEDLALCLNVGADDFISKPVNGLELRARVRSMLRIKSQHDIIQSEMKLREDMTSMIVHDLRNPISTIVLAGEALAKVELPERPKQKLHQILSSIGRLRSLVDDILIVSKGQAGKLTLDLAEVDLGDVARAAILDFEPMIKSKEIQLVSKVPEKSPKVWLDDNLIRRVFDNLIANAIKFSPAHSQISLQIDYPQDSYYKARIQIADLGKGVSESMRQSIFEKYEVGQIINGVSQIGLGLSFCKMVVEAHKGRIFVEDNHPQGSVFTVEIMS